MRLCLEVICGYLKSLGSLPTLIQPEALDGELMDTYAAILLPFGSRVKQLRKNGITLGVLIGARLAFRRVLLSPSMCGAEKKGEETREEDIGCALLSTHRVSFSGRTPS